MKVALGAAKGLAFLHEEAERPVIYRDFKTSNILLDAVCYLVQGLYFYFFKYLIGRPVLLSSGMILLFFFSCTFFLMNNLLFQDYNAKLSDFGLAKDGPEGDKTHVSTRVMGTYGYAAPEYVMTGEYYGPICFMYL